MLFLAIDADTNTAVWWGKRLFLLLLWGLIAFLLWQTWGNVGLAGSIASRQGQLAVSTRPLPEAFYVDPAGSDTTGDGSASAPWQSIQHAVDSVPEGSVVRVQAGVYHGRVSLTRRYKGGGLLLSADPPYQAQLRHDHQVIICFTCTDVTIEGFDMAHSGPGAERYVVQIQDAADDGRGGKQITLRNNIFHDSYNNDLLKINNGAQQIRVTGNLFYNQAGQDSHIDLTSAREVLIEDNIFFNDFAGSGREDAQDTGSFLLIKDVDGASDGIVGSNNIQVRRNLFLNWSGGRGNAFIALGDNSGRDYFHAYDILIENNLLLGNTAVSMHTPLKIIAGQNVVFRHNTIVGDLPTVVGYAFRLDTGNLPNEQIQFYNNIWADPTGTMGAESPTDSNRLARTANTESVLLRRNLYWNGSNPIPADPNEPVNYTDDPTAVIADPLLPYDQRDLLAPRWYPALASFGDGSPSIRGVFVGLVQAYGALGVGSTAVDNADATQSPPDDILGQPRRVPDIGAYEQP